MRSLRQVGLWGCLFTAVCLVDTPLVTAQTLTPSGNAIRPSTPAVQPKASAPAPKAVPTADPTPAPTPAQTAPTAPPPAPKAASGPPAAPSAPSTGPVEVPDFDKIAPSPFPESSNPNLKDEEPDTLLEGKEIPTAKSPEASGKPSRKIIPPEFIQSFSSPLQISRRRGEIFFVGRTRKESALFVYDSKKRKFFSLSTLREGYSLIPIGFASNTRTLVFGIRPYRQDSLWLTQHSFRSPTRGQSVHLGTFTIKDQKWRFGQFPFLAFLSNSSQFWLSNNTEHNHFLSTLDGDVRRYIAPFQSAESTSEVLQAFVLNAQGGHQLVWMDHCTTAADSAMCLWTSPTPSLNTPLPSLFSKLPGQIGKKAVLKVDQAGPILCLTVWDEGSETPTRRYWRTSVETRWRLFWENKFADPPAHTVVQQEGPGRIAFYFLSTTDGVNTQLNHTVIDTSSNASHTTASKEVTGLPFHSDLLYSDDTHMIVVSDTGLLEVNLKIAFQ